MSRPGDTANCVIEDANGIPCLSMTELMVEQNNDMCGSSSIIITATSCSEDRLYYQWSGCSHTHLSPVGTEDPEKPDLLECQNFEDNTHRTRCQQQCYTCGNGYRKPCHVNTFFCECGCVSDDFSFEECVAVCPPFPEEWNEECVRTCVAACPADGFMDFHELHMQ